MKICGVTRPADAELAAELGAWAVGLIFHAPSPRAVEVERAEEIGVVLERRAEVTGVFANEHLERIVYLADRCKLTVVQLHGSEGPAFCDEVARRTGARVMKAARVKDAASVRALRAFRRVDFHMLDAYTADKLGGTGQAFDWSLAEGHAGPPLVLSGGLTPENVEAGIRALHPFAVDTASGTDARPGIKDESKVRDFFAAVERAGDMAGTVPEPFPAGESPAPPADGGASAAADPVERA